MIRLTLVSHGATEATMQARFPADESLRPAAGDAITVIRASLATVRTDFWTTAPERRTWDTAIGLGAPAEVVIDPALRDWNSGAWAGQTMVEVGDGAADALARWLTEPDFAPLDGESRTSLLARVAEWMVSVASGKRRSVLAVTHPFVMRAAFVSALAAPPTTFWLVDIAPLTRLTFSHDGRRWHLRALIPPA